MLLKQKRPIHGGRRLDRKTMLDRSELEMLSTQPAGLHPLAVTGAITLIAAAALAIFLDSRIPHQSTAPSCATSEQVCTSTELQPAKGALAPAIR